MKMKRRNLAILFAVILLVTGCKQHEAPKHRTVKVKVTKVQSVALLGEQNFSGTVEELTGAVLSFPVAGTISRIQASEGQRVNKGDFIAALDEISLKNSYEAESAALRQAEDSYMRMKQLHDNNSLPEIQWVEVQSKLKQAQSAEQIAKKNLSDCRLLAPFSGVIATKDVEVGQNVMPGMPVVRLVAVNRVKVKMSVPENEISHVAIGQDVSILVPALDGKTYTGKVVEKGVVANSLSRSYEVKALIENPKGELLPGMICTLFFEREESSSVILLPINVVQTDNSNKNFVWVNDNGKARKRFIETGTLMSYGIVVTSGVSDGEEVLIEGQRKVSNGTDIEIER